MKYQEYKELSDAMEQAAHKFYQLRYQMSNGGNLSMRAPGHDWMLVKATDVAFDEVCADTIVVTDFDGNLIEAIGNHPKKLFCTVRSTGAPGGVRDHALPFPICDCMADKHETLDFRRAIRK